MKNPSITLLIKVIKSLKELCTFRENDLQIQNWFQSVLVTLREF